MANVALDNKAAGGRDTVKYFRGLSLAYSRQTGNATYDLVHSFLSKLPQSALSPSAVVHDNACGVGTATLAILALTGEESPARIEATDISEAMIAQLSSQATEEGWTNIHAAVADSHVLPFDNNTFTLSITNISVSNFTEASTCLTEIRRTLKPEGLAVVSIWSRFVVAELVHSAQRSIKGNGVEVMKVPHDEFFAQGYLKTKIQQAGFQNVVENEEEVVVQGEWLAGLREFLLGPMTASARAGWSQGELDRWEGAIDQAIEAEIAANGGRGVAMKAWFVTGQK